MRLSLLSLVLLLLSGKAPSQVRTNSVTRHALTNRMCKQATAQCGESSARVGRVKRLDYTTNGADGVSISADSPHTSASTRSGDWPAASGLNCSICASSDGSGST